MAPTPFRRRGKVSKAARTARNLALADAALALARDRVGGRSHSRRPSGKALLLGGAAVAAAAGLLYKRDKVAGLLPSHAETHEPHQPGPSNYDAPGPVANTATPVPAPEPRTTTEAGSIDEAAEEAAAAAEAANIGGPVSDYAGPAAEHATEAERPLAEAGEGASEGQEQAELGLEEAAQPTAPGMSDSERQIDETIDQAANPFAGERVEPVPPGEENAPPPESAEQPDTPKEDDGNDWRTWSGRSVNP
jgi:hypothetical protein